MNVSRREQVKIALYDKFYKSHKDLFEKDKVLYWHQCASYVEAEFSKKLSESFNKDYSKVQKYLKEESKSALGSRIGNINQIYKNYKVKKRVKKLKKKEGDSKSNKNLGSLMKSKKLSKKKIQLVAKNLESFVKQYDLGIDGSGNKLVYAHSELKYK